MANSPKHWPPIVVAFLCFVGCSVMLGFEMRMLLRIRKDPFDKASLDTLAAGTTYGECVGYADGGSVERAYGEGAAFGRYRFLGFILTDAGKEDVDCTLNSAARQLGRLVAASVHSLRHAVDSAEGQLDPDLELTYKTAAMAVKGLKLPVNYSAAVNALASLPATPTSCASIYSGTPDAELVYTPSDTVATICDAKPASLYPLPSQAQMFRHCINQFKLGQFAPDVDDYSWNWKETGHGGTLGLPVYGQKLDPLLPLGTSAGLGNSSMTTEQRTRVLYGYRYGLTLFASIPAIALLCFLLFDAVAFLFAEITLNSRLGAMMSQSDNGGEAANKALTMLAALGNVRELRGYVSLFAVIVIVVFQIVFVTLPFVDGALLPLPSCQSGGWLRDREAPAIEWATIFVVFSATVALPFSQNAIFRVDRKRNATVVPINTSTPVRINADFESKFARYAFTLVILGAVVQFFAQGAAAYVFGEAWAERVAETDPTDTYSAAKYGDIVNTKISGLVGIAVFAGTLGAIVLANYFFRGQNMHACTIMLGWLGVVFLAFLPLALVESFSFSASDFDRDCAQLDGAAEGACRARFFVFGAGLAIVALPLLVLLCFCGSRYSCVFCNPRDSGTAVPRFAFRSIFYRRRPWSSPRTSQAAGADGPPPLYFEVPAREESPPQLQRR